MSAIDNVFGMDWSDAQYIGDGVYIRDATDHLGVPAIALRTDRGFEHQIIVFESSDFHDMVRYGSEILARASGRTEVH